MFSDCWRLIKMLVTILIGILKEMRTKCYYPDSDCFILSDSSYRQQIQALLGKFSQAEALLTSAGVQPGGLDRILLDAGCSSMQLDTPERGFSLRKDGPLDMRMDGGRYILIKHFFLPTRNQFLNSTLNLISF